MNGKLRDLSARIAERVREQRSERGWSQPELARRASLSNAMVSMVERGERTPSLEALAALAAALELDPGSLLSAEEDASATSAAHKLGAELAELKLTRADLEAVRRIARALAGEARRRR